MDAIEIFLDDLGEPGIYDDIEANGLKWTLDTLEADGYSIPDEVWEAFEERKKKARSNRGALMDSMEVYMGADASGIDSLRRD